MVLRRLLGALVFVGSMANAAIAQDALQWSTDLAAAQKAAAQTNRLVLLHFWGTWCPPCMKMENEVFTKPGLGAAIHPYFVPCKIQVEDGMNQDLVKQFGVDGFPCDIVLTSTGQVITKSKGFKAPAEYLALLNQAAQTALRSTTVPASSASAPAQVAAAPTSHASASSTMPPTTPQASVPQSVSPATAARSTASDDRYAYYFQERRTPAPLPAPVPATPAAPEVSAATAAAAAEPLKPATSVPTSMVAPAPAPRPPLTPPSTPLPAAPGVPPAIAKQESVPPATQPARSQSAPAALRLPPGSPPLALDGYCPVTVTEKMVWKRGDVRFGAIHRGRTYLFASAAEQTKFLANPDRFSPIISGNDPVVALEKGEAVPGKRELGIMCGERMILFSSQESYDKFVKDSKRYSSEIRQALLSDQAGTLRR